MSIHNRLLVLASAILTVAIVTDGTVRAQAPLTLGPLFQDHAVLQRDTPIAIWGIANPNDELSVSFMGKTATAHADAEGRWRVTLPPISAGGPDVLEVRTKAGATRTVADVIVGDVFLCSGQSNMEFGVAQSSGGEMALARSANDKIRVLSIAHAAAPQPASAFGNAPAWQAAGPDSLRRFSAACYHFGREVHETQKVPVGLRNASWGGSAIEPWISDAGLRAIGGFDARLDMLRVFARDEEAANQGYGRLWEDWWRQHGASAGEPWKPEGAGPWTGR